MKLRLTLAMLAAACFFAAPASAGNFLDHFSSCDAASCDDACAAAGGDAVGCDILGLFSKNRCPSAPACLPAPVMFGDAGLLNPRVFTSTGGLQPTFQNHFYKVAENNSAVPQDRIGVNLNLQQDVYSGVRDGIKQDLDLTEFRLFFEKTLLDGQVSFDFMLPFYYTGDYAYSSNLALVSNYPDRDEAFGDLAFGIKGLLHRSDALATSLGLRVEAPTGREIEEPVGPGDFYRSFDDDVWSFTPYLAALWTPNERCFAQSFLSYRLNSTQLSERDSTLEIRENTYLMADLQLGYWLVRNPRARFLTGLAPVVELHYTGSFDNESVSGVPAPGTNTLTNRVYGRTDRLNLTLGSQAYFRNNLSAGVAVVAPLRENNQLFVDAQVPTDRSFDWAMMFHINYFFGR